MACQFRDFHLALASIIWSPLFYWMDVFNLMRSFQFHFLPCYQYRVIFFASPTNRPFVWIESEEREEILIYGREMQWSLMFVFKFLLQKIFCGDNDAFHFLQKKPNDTHIFTHKGIEYHSSYGCVFAVIAHVIKITIKINLAPVALLLSNSVCQAKSTLRRLNKKGKQTK